MTQPPRPVGLYPAHLEPVRRKDWVRLSTCICCFWGHSGLLRWNLKDVCRVAKENVFHERQSSKACVRTTPRWRLLDGLWHAPVVSLSWACPWNSWWYTFCHHLYVGPRFVFVISSDPSRVDGVAVLSGGKRVLPRDLYWSDGPPPDGWCFVRVVARKPSALQSRVWIKGGLVRWLFYNTKLVCPSCPTPLRNGLFLHLCLFVCSSTSVLHCSIINPKVCIIFG